VLEFRDLGSRFWVHRSAFMVKGLKSKVKGLEVKGKRKKVRTNPLSTGNSEDLNLEPPMKLHLKRTAEYRISNRRMSKDGFARAAQALAPRVAQSFL
jgi:hypothetical protein